MTQTIILECSNGKKLKKNCSDHSSAMSARTQKFPKGYSSDYIPEYRYVVEAVGETQGLNNSSCGDSEDSCARKRKCMNLNGNQSNSFNVPVQVISTSRMSGSERKDLEMKLRGELEKVQVLRKKIPSRIPAVASGVALSSSCDGHTRNKGLNREILGRFEPMKQGPPRPSGNLVAMILKQCETLLKNLMQHKCSWVFNTPVDVVKLQIPDYFNIIKHPMDLGTIKKKLASGSYSNPWAFASDVRLTFTNAMTYNPPGNDVHIMADMLNKIFEKRWKPIGQKLAAAEEAVKRDEEATKTQPPSLPMKKKSPPMEYRVAMSKNVKPKMPYNEKQELSKRLQSLIEDMPDHIIDFLRKQTNNVKSTEDEIEIDIESLSDDTLFELRKLLDDHFDVKQSAIQAKVEPCEMEILVEPGVSNSSIHPSQVNEPAEEEIDIGEDDPPISSYPSVQMENDTAPRISKCSSSSGSSSESGSSSSDSESGGSSGSDSDTVAATPTNSVKENEPPGVVRGLEKCDGAGPGTIRGMGQQNRSACLEPGSVEAGGCQGGETTTERQVSPDKLYRAALLRSRYADTILKAREKTLNQDDNKDPGILQHEREELERQKREERARLQAEAKAVEDARGKAAAAEAKRKRELERAAARQALLQMEKMVEINENSLFMKDLEILGTAHGEHIPTSMVHEMSPAHLGGLGGFNLGGSNPLEQLGLFRKDDDDEEDECGMTNATKHEIERRRD